MSSSLLRGLGFVHRVDGAEPLRNILQQAQFGRTTPISGECDEDALEETAVGLEEGRIIVVDDELGTCTSYGPLGRLRVPRRRLVLLRDGDAYRVVHMRFGAHERLLFFVCTQRGRSVRVYRRVFACYAMAFFAGFVGAKQLIWSPTLASSGTLGGAFVLDS